MRKEFQNLYKTYEEAKAVKDKIYSQEARVTLDKLLEKEEPGIELASTQKASDVEADIAASGVLNHYQNNIITYVDTNLDSLLGDIVNKDNALLLATGFKQYLGNSKGKIIKEIQANKEILQSGNINVMAEELLQNVKSDLLKSIFGNILNSGNQQWIVDNYEALIGTKYQRLEKDFSKDGKLDVGAVKTYIADNLRAAPEKEKPGTYIGFADYVAKTYEQKAQKQAAYKQAA